MTIALRTLTEEEFNATFSPPMVNVTGSADEVVVLWGYAEPALREVFPDICSCDWNLKHIHESSDGSFQHVFIPTHVSNLYLVIVIDKLRRRILGHHLCTTVAYQPKTAYLIQRGARIKRHRDFASHSV